MNEMTPSSLPEIFERLGHFLNVMSLSDLAAMAGFVF
jgi:hypothetical protein